MQWWCSFLLLYGVFRRQKKRRRKCYSTKLLNCGWIIESFHLHDHGWSSSNKLTRKAHNVWKHLGRIYVNIQVAQYIITIIISCVVVRLLCIHLTVVSLEYCALYWCILINYTTHAFFFCFFVFSCIYNLYTQCCWIDPYIYNSFWSIQYKYSLVLIYTMLVWLRKYGTVYDTLRGAEGN